MSSNEYWIQRPRSRALRMTLTAAVLAMLLAGCTERATEAKAPAATSAPEVVDEPAASPPVAEAVKPPDAAALIGTTMPPYPQGLTEVQGVCVPGGEAPERVCDYGLAVLGRELTETSPTNVYLVASRNVDPEASQPQWTITDALDAPENETGYELQLGGCRLENELRSDIVAFVRHSDAEYSSDITWVKRFDARTGKFADIERDRVDCINAGYGI
jgi:hypothetical protein